MITLIPCLYWAPIPVGPSSFLLFSLFLAAVDQISLSKKKGPVNIYVVRRVRICTRCYTATCMYMPLCQCDDVNVACVLFTDINNECDEYLSIVLYIPLSFLLQGK